jgi:hypothetical protein
MKRKRFAPEKIIRMLREAEVSLPQGLTVGQVSRQLGISGKPITAGGNSMVE